MDSISAKPAHGWDDSRVTGRIANWNDARGYGFVASDPGGPRAFVHISAFAGASGDPSTTTS